MGRSRSRSPATRSLGRGRSRSPRGRRDSRRRSPKGGRGRSEERRSRGRDGGLPKGAIDRRGRGGDGCSVLVRNLGPGTTKEELTRIFEEIAEVKDVHIPRDYHTQQSKSFGFVEFFESRHAEKALRELDGEKINGSAVAVILAKHGRRSPGAMRGREDRGRGRDSRRRGRY
ncbi:unnamed protein product [Amoebophrya sp. A25]|nr:unnamed protein product [Amoebophrya sp. A25]|eukprot:GSA25T00019405001.1